MLSQSRSIFDRSFAALALVHSRSDAQSRSQVRFPRLVLPRTGRNAMAMSIPYAPEAVPTAHVLDLTEDQTTGPLSLGFQFEFFGVSYNWFDLSAGGFITFGIESRTLWPGSRPGHRFIPLNADLNNFLALEWCHGRVRDQVRIAYDLRGSVGRRRLVLSLSAESSEGSRGVVMGQLILRERTGMIEVHTARYGPGESRIDERAVRFTTAC